MFHSSEIRWFFEGDPDPSIDEWFARSQLGKREPPRTDRYLCLPGCTTVGVKIREGLLEIKAQTRGAESVRLPNGIAGSQSSWVKWSRQLDDTHGLTEGDDTWVALTKERRLRLFAPKGDEVEEGAAGRIIDGPGCNIELSRVELAGEGSGWWSVCLEAFGAPAESGDVLRLVASQPALASIAGFLPPENSLSYPEWLAGRFAP